MLISSSSSTLKKKKCEQLECQSAEARAQTPASEETPSAETIRQAAIYARAH